MSDVRYFDTHEEKIEGWQCPECDRNDVYGEGVYSRDGELLKFLWLLCPWDDCNWDQFS
jgi:hypothetical protein